ncbi:hypothetical protein WMF37_30320 [Sorangium sp. So ce291]
MTCRGRQSAPPRSRIRVTALRDDASKAFVLPVPMSFGPSSAGLGLVGRF